LHLHEHVSGSNVEFGGHLTHCARGLPGLFGHRFEPGGHVQRPVAGLQKKSQHSKSCRHGAPSWRHLPGATAPARVGLKTATMPPNAVAATSFSAWRRETDVESAFEKSSNRSSLIGTPF
jgi:hypothetical protein